MRFLICYYTTEYCMLSGLHGPANQTRGSRPAAADQILSFVHLRRRCNPRSQQPSRMPPATRSTAMPTTSAASADWTSDVELVAIRVERVGSDSTVVTHHVELLAHAGIYALIEPGRDFICLRWPLGGVWKVDAIDRASNMLWCSASRSTDLSTDQIDALNVRYASSQPFAEPLFGWEMREATTSDGQLCVSPLTTPLDPSATQLTARLLTLCASASLDIHTIHDINTVSQRYLADVTWTVTIPTIITGRRSAHLYEFLAAIDFCEDEFTFSNALDVRKEGKIKTVVVTHDSHSSVVNGSHESDLHFSQRLLAEFTAEMALQTFPFDCQTLRFSFAAGRGLPSRVSIEPTPGRPGRFAHDHFTMESAWRTVMDDMVFVGAIDADSADKAIHFEVVLERKSTHYLTNIAVPAMVLTYLCFSSYAPLKEMKKDDKKGSQLMGTEARLQIVLALLLTAVTFKNQVAASIPQVSYFTTLDKFVYACFLTACAVAVETALFPLIARWWGQTDVWREYYLLWTSVWIFTLANVFWAWRLHLWLVNRGNILAWVPDLARYARALARRRGLDEHKKRKLLLQRIRTQQSQEMVKAGRAATACRPKSSVETAAKPGEERHTDPAVALEEDDRVTQTKEHELLNAFTLTTSSGGIFVRLPRKSHVLDEEFSAIEAVDTHDMDGHFDALVTEDIARLQRRSM